MNDNIDINFVIGAPVKHGDFLFREEFVKDLWDSLKRDNVLLLAPRRMGKTSVMYRLLEKPMFEFQVIHLNVEPIDEPKMFFLHLIDAMQEHQPALLRRLAQGLSFLSKLTGRLESLQFGELKVALRKTGSLDKDWHDLAKEFFDRMQASREKILFSIDEFPDMILRMNEKHEAEVSPFLHLLRSYRILPECSVRWLFSGSINLKSTLSRMKLLPTINDLSDEMLPPFTGAQVALFVTHALTQRDVCIADDLIPRVQALLGEPIPFFLQLLTKELYRYWRNKKLEFLGAADADEVFQKAILGEVVRDKLQHYRSRIFIYYPENRQEIACSLLNLLTAAEDGIPADTLYRHFQQFLAQQGEQYAEHRVRDEFNYLMSLLQGDFYVERGTDGHFDFVSKVIKTWWEKHYGHGP